MSTALIWGLSIAAGLLLAFFGDPWLKRHPLAGCWFFGLCAVFFAAAAAGNAVLQAWGWMAAQVVIAFASAATFRRYQDRRKRAKEAA